MPRAMTAPWPSFTDEEQQAAARVIGSNRVNYWTGEEGRAFEAEFAQWVGLGQGDRHGQRHAGARRRR